MRIKRSLPLLTACDFICILLLYIPFHRISFETGIIAVMLVSIRFYICESIFYATEKISKKLRNMQVMQSSNFEQEEEKP